MASPQANKRLTKEYLIMQKSPNPLLTAKPKENNILEWHYVITGPKDSPYADGEYWGKLTFPKDYPFKAPRIVMITPSGRFKPDTRLCFSMSDYHPELWNPAWSVATILAGILSFMLENESTSGSVISSDEQKKVFASQSHAFNRSQTAFTGIIMDPSSDILELFPELVKREIPQEHINFNIQQQKLRQRQKQKQISQSENQEQDDRQSEQAGTQSASTKVWSTVGSLGTTVVSIVLLLVVVKIFQMQ